MTGKTIQNEDKNDSGIFFKYALVLVELKGLSARTFSYLIPDEFKNIIKIGQPVLVPFGQQGIVNAFVVGFANYLEEGIKPKSIIEILDEKEVFSLEYLKILEWIADYYCCDLASVITQAVPMKFFKKNKRVIIKITEELLSNLEKEDIKILNFLKLNIPSSISYIHKKTKLPYHKFYSSIRKLKGSGFIQLKNILDEQKQKTQYEKYIKFKNKEGASKRQLVILNKLEETGESNLIEFERLAKTTRATLKKLEQNGFVEIFENQVYRNPLDVLNITEKETAPPLNQEQTGAYKFIEKKIDEKSTEPVLLYGVTASGKTEIYFKAIEKILAEGKNVLFLAPEIALASQLTIRLARRFGTQDTAVWHSSISEGERYDVWQKLRNNEIRILAGARSAVFAPLQNIGLIIIDEEHETSYKQTTPTPRYNAKTAAYKLAEMHSAAVILGSATPDIQSYYRALNSGNLIKLEQRFNNAPLAKVSIVDMREEFYKQNKTIISRTLKDEIHKNLANKKQILLLLNRRGFATHSVCLSCGEVIKCENCSIPMVFHSDSNTLKCHWCNNEKVFPDKCPKCGSEVLKNYGLGTQKVEMIIKKMFPSVNTERLDSDALATKTGYIDILERFNNHQIDILIGTQMIAKGLDNKNVTLVGVINSDASFNLPDYKASERGFQLLTQVAGRAGRGEFEGKVIFQTYNPDFYAITNAKNQDYLSFYSEEITSRSLFDYPPFSNIIKIVLSSKNNFRAEKSAQEIALRLNTMIDKYGISERIIVLGPSSCILEKINNEYRFQIIIKNKMDKKGHSFISSFFKKIKLPEDIKLIIDVDPVDIL